MKITSSITKSHHTCLYFIHTMLFHQSHKSYFKLKFHGSQIFYQKHKAPCSTLPSITNMIYILSHAYNILIHNNNHLPKLEKWWSSPKVNLGFWELKGFSWNFLEKHRNTCVFVMDKKIRFLPLYIGPQFPSLATLWH